MITAAIFLQSVKLLKKCLKEEYNDDSESDDDENDEFMENGDSDNNFENVVNRRLKDSATNLFNDCLINPIRWTAHTLQLVVSDAIKEGELNSKISLCHKLAVALRKPAHISKIMLQRIMKPILNTPTRLELNILHH